MTGLFQGRDLQVERSPGRRSFRAVLQRLKALTRPDPEETRATRLRRLDEVCAVLGDARAIIEAGWVQDRWYAKVTGPRSDGSPTGTDIPGACLVGAVVRANQRRHPEGDPTAAGPVIDVLWDAWQESRGLNGPGVAGRAAPVEVRVARVRDLTRWNDRPGRARAEVLGLVDLAVSRAVMAAMTMPVTTVPAPTAG
jgi:hypothetical protein